MNDSEPAATPALADSSGSRGAADPPERGDPRHPLPAPPRGVAWKHLWVAARALGSLLLGGVAILGPIVLFRQGLLPLLDAIFRPKPDVLSAIRRAGILMSAIGGYLAYVRWYEKRPATELRLQPIRLLLGGAGGALLVAIPIALLFAVGAYERVNVRAPSSALLGVAVLIGIAATLEELIHRGLIFRVLERAWGTGVALAGQAVLFALPHLENLEHAGTGQVAVLLVSVSVLGLMWAGLFVLTRDLWVAAANHAAWNFTILSSGVPLSGIEDWRPLAPLETRSAGSDWLTGGPFGPESSLLVIASTTAAVALLLRTAKRRGEFRKPAS